MPTYGTTPFVVKPTILFVENEKGVKGKKEKTKKKKKNNTIREGPNPLYIAKKPSLRATDTSPCHIPRYILATRDVLLTKT
jgi:hypothetical protein